MAQKYFWKALQATLKSQNLIQWTKLALIYSDIVYIVYSDMAAAVSLDVGTCNMNSRIEKN